MSKIEKQVHLEFYTLVADIEETFTSEVRVEECHGEHMFLDTEILSQEIVNLKIVIGHEEIDITNRMTKEELQLMLKAK